MATMVNVQTNLKQPTLQTDRKKCIVKLATKKIYYKGKFHGERSRIHERMLPEECIIKTRLILSDPPVAERRRAKTATKIIYYESKFHGERSRTTDTYYQKMYYKREI